MLSKQEENIKKRILDEIEQDKIIQIYKTENISINIINDKEVQEHLVQYIKIKEIDGTGHIYLRKKENATKDYIEKVNKFINQSTY